MKKLKKSQQEIMIDIARSGDINNRDELFNYYYDIAIMFLERLNIPSDIKEDLTQEIAVCILDMIDNSEFKVKSDISLQIHEHIINVICNYLQTVYSYNRNYNGKTYHSANSYLHATKGYGLNPSDVLSELVTQGKRREEQLSDISSGCEYMDELANSSLLIDKYFEFASTLPLSKKLIFLGRIPICDEAFKTEEELSKELNVAKQYIGQVTQEVKLDFLSYSNVAYLLGFSNEEKVRLVRDRYNTKLRRKNNIHQVKKYDRNTGEIIE